MPTTLLPLSLRPGFRSSLVLRDVLLCVVAGVGITLIVGLGYRPVLRPREFFKSIALSLLIFAIAQLALAWVGRRVGPLSAARRVGIQAVILFLAGDLGYVLVVAIQVFLHNGRVELPWLWLTLPLPIVGFLSVAFGLALFTFDLQRLRLAESIARLKETEFAERELHLARALQGRLLPPQEIEGEGYRISARNLAARVVAGDFYDVFPLADGRLGLVVADVAGKGMAASLIMASVKAMIPLIAAERTPAEALREVNRRLARELSPREFVALSYARFDPATGALVLANAGLPDPYRLSSTAAAEPLSVPGPRLPLGVRREVEYGSLEMALAPGERLLFFTDGLAEAPTTSGEPLGYDALAELLDGAPGAPPWDGLDVLFERIREATAPGLEDDWTALLLERARL